VKEITSESIKQFIKDTQIPFVGTQTKICVPNIFRICQKMAHGIKFEEIKTCDNLIIEGHHRYLSALIVNFELGQVSTQRTSATKEIPWNNIELDNEDWDTPAKIAHLNELDAIYNNVDLEIINEITNR
jgi:hypothetical protein